MGKEISRSKRRNRGDLPMNTCVKPCDDYKCGICREEEAEAEESHNDMGDL